MTESLAQFENRKKDHIRIALDQGSQAVGLSGLDRVQLVHEALPDLNFSEIDSQLSIFNKRLSSPLFISSMTAGHADGLRLNEILAEAAQKRSWAMGVGSQRRELNDLEASHEWKAVRKMAPRALLMGNLGLAQVIETKPSEIQRLIDNLEASALFVHLNPLQECLQLEGTPNFRGGFAALESLIAKINVPVVIKETGCGLSAPTLQRFKNIGVFAVDVAGLGGTHWGRVEGYRAPENNAKFGAAQTFKNWGISTVESLLVAQEIDPDYQVWASGGVRTGLDVAKLVAMGAQMVGMAHPVLQAAIQGPEVLDQWMAQIEFELKVAMFCTGSQTIKELQGKRVWTWK